MTVVRIRLPVDPLPPRIFAETGEADLEPPVLDVGEVVHHAGQGHVRRWQWTGKLLLVQTVDLEEHRGALVVQKLFELP